MGCFGSHSLLGTLTFALFLAVAVDASRGAGDLRVYLPDGSAQCGKDGVAKDGRSLADDRTPIEKLGIRVIAEEKKKLPVNAITLCGAPTGNVNTYVILADDWKRLGSSLKAEGFNIWPLDSPTVIVFQYDGSRQCFGEGISLEDMAKILAGAGIKIMNQRKAHDGLARTANCGNHTGIFNAYEIASSDLDKALGLGFSYLTTPDSKGETRPLGAMSARKDARTNIEASPWPFPW